ncbi:DUF6054 family protein [Listeria costaricensis]|uniref:DUF6054 family protein n=1 Tax=Listeria costaricensis TaxID=2026604 RepID=UPI000C076058|nr:DUF6054 family protein [Listeria costaricensis]
MPSYRYVVKSSVEETMDMIKLSQAKSNPIFEELRIVMGEHKIATLAYEKYYMRNSNRAALFVTIHDFYDQAEVTVISTGSSDGFLFNFDWGAAHDYIASVKKVLRPVLISETEIKYE